LDADAAGLMLADQRGALQVVASSSEEARLLELLELQYAEGPCLDCFRRGEIVANVDPDEAQERWPTFGVAVRAAHFTSVHSIPLRLRDKVIGAMNLFLTRPGTLTERDLALGQAVADIATIGLLQERAIFEQQVLAEQLQGALNSRIVIEQAKGMLSERHGLATDSAFSALRTHARRTGQALVKVASQVVDGTLDTAQLTSSGT
ncbi:MAG: GAF and ANTAR domain-containing protein, partial [Mycobacteriales bacterium]